MEFLNHLWSVIPDVSAPWLVGAALGLEFVFRLSPTQKPLSIAHVVGAVVRKSGEILVKLADLLDKLLPQKLKSPE